LYDDVLTSSTSIKQKLNGKEKITTLSSHISSNSLHGSSGVLQMSTTISRREQPPREESILQPINGIVQPPVVPPPNRPGRTTNKLEYIQKKIMKALLKHSLAWPFRKPVDAKKLGLPVSQHIFLFLAFCLPLTSRILTPNFSGLFRNH
jgi:hypothetical protein